MSKNPNLKVIEGGKSTSAGKGKGGSDETAAPTKCLATACKTKPVRMEFCDEHFDQFKFGLIKKDGKAVPDYDKKLDAYNRYKSNQTQIRKVA